MDELTTFLDYEDQLNVIQCVRSIVDGTTAPSEANGNRSSAGGSGEGGASTKGTSATSTRGGGEVTALWVTHRLEELDYADCVSYMDGGRIVFSGTPHQMKAYMRQLGAQI
jgi:hypothetical protein